MAVLLLAMTSQASAEVGPADLTGEDKELFDKFRDLFQNGAPDEFYSFAEEYEQDLKKKGYMMLYYKLKNNEGFYALRHNMIYRAMQAAKELDDEVRADGASQYFYLATGLMGDVYYVCRDRKKAEQYLTQALEEVGNRDPKFSMRLYQTLAEMLCLKDSEKAKGWMEESLALAQKTDNVEYYSLSLAMMAYIHFLDGNSLEFFRYYDQYEGLRSMGKPGFSHRYDNFMEVGKLAFEDNYAAAMAKLQEGRVYVDSSLVAIRIFAMERDVEKEFGAVKRSFLETDSVHSLMQNANFDQMASERTLMRSREEAAANKKLVMTLLVWMIVLTVLFVVAYVWERRRLIRKILAKSKALEEALDKAEESDRMKSAFIRNMSHEIRTPINAISGFSQVLCTPDYTISDEDKRDMMDRITDNVKVITTIVGELLDLSEGESVHEKTEVAVNALCREAMSHANATNTNGLEMRFSTQLANDFTITTNQEHLKNILHHLLDNAVKFTPSGHVMVRCEEKDGKLVITVSDTGIGIAKEHQERVFDKFVKLSEYTGGVGLGLSISRQLARELGGDIVMDGNYRKGARFVVTIPTA